MKCITIHHFDDEPEHVRWIPSALLNRCLIAHPEWMGPELTYDDHDPSATVFVLFIDGEELRICHKLYRTAEEFRADFGESAVSGDIVLIDMMDGSTAPVGLPLYDIAVRELGEDVVFVFTAYPHSSNALERLPKERVIAKPPDVNQLVSTLIESIGLER